MARPALNETEIGERRREFLDAAHRLFRERRQLPPVAEIAAAAGLAKGTVYRYFGSKEEIFVALLEDDFRLLFAGLGPLLTSLPAAPAVAAKRFASGYCALLAGLPDLLPLGSLANGVLEQNLPEAAMRRFKSGLAAGLVAAGKMLEKRFATLARGQGAALLLATYGLSLGLWQALDYPENLQRLLDEPGLRVLRRDFAKELEAALRQMWLGALAGA